MNFIINYLLLLAAAKFCGAGFSRLRLALAAGVGALYAMAVWLPGWMFLANWPGKLASGVIMLAAAFAGRLGLRRFAKTAVSFLAASFLLGGVVLALGMITGAPKAGGIPYVPIDFKTLFITAGLSYAVLTLVFRQSWRHSPGDKTDLHIRWDDREQTVTALIDTGHTLQDPMSGREVIILNPDLARTLAPPRLQPFLDKDLLRDAVKLFTLMGAERDAARFRLIPYHTIGVEAGFLLAFRPDSVRLRGRERKDCLIGFAPAPLSAGGDIEALVSAEK